MQIGITIFGILLFYSVACVNFGLLIYHVLLIDKKNTQADSSSNEFAVFATAFLLGQGTLATVWIMLGLAGEFYPVIVKILVSTAVLSGLPFIPPHFKGLWLQIKNIYYETRSDSWTWQVIAFIGLLFCLAGASSLGAPLLEDSANFYMTQPKVMVETHRYQLIMGKEPYYSGGFQGEMNHAVLMSLGSTDAARLYSWITLLAGTVILLALSARTGTGRRGQWIALAMIMTSSMIHAILGKGKVDLFPMAMGLGVYYWMTYNSVHARRISGLLAGFAVLGKAIYAVTLFPGMLILLVWQQFQKQSNNDNPSFLFFLNNGLELAFWGGGLAIASMFIYNYFLFDNLFKVNDYASSFFGWGTFKEYVPPHIYVTMPLYLSFGRIRYGQLGNLSVLVLMFAPLTFLIPRLKRWLDSVLVAVTLSAFSGVFILAIFYPTVITAPRYYMACLLLFIPMSSFAAEYITLTESKPRMLTFVIQMSLIIVLFSTFIENTQGQYYDSFFFKKSVQYLHGNVPECGLEDRWLGQRCRALSAINDQAHLGDRIVSNVYHNYYLRSDLLLCQDSEWKLLVGDDNWSLNWGKIYSSGYRFIAIDKFYSQFPDVSRHPLWVNPVIIFEEGDLIVYRLDYNSPPEGSVLSCREVQKGVWRITK